MPSKSNVSNSVLKGGFRYGHRSFVRSEFNDHELRKRLGTTVSVSTYEELVDLTDRYQLRFSEILDEATALGLMEKSAKALLSKRK